MSNRAAKPRVLSRSGQPRRRLARRRQQLPHPVRRDDKVDEDLHGGDQGGLPGALNVLGVGNSLDALLAGANKDAESESIVSD